ncbi:hypothetical protein PVL29_019603 [Vitis rotundifolia]|uniref:Uncharacterized protein n=1 Tax=Vitis rotundifolia TaxID=103349 RepID=A0AA39DE13_VITRO|nr:hypothetical protein PVL29_019603 [Vitis rotundifolia]
MASRALQIAPRNRSRNPSFIHRVFSSSSTSNDADNNNPSPPSSSSSSSSSSLSSYFNDVKASLKQPPQPPRKSSSFSSSSPSSSPPLSSKIASLEEIRKNLSEFRSRSSVPNPSPSQQSSSSSPISFQELYKRNVIPKPEDSPKGKLSFDAIRESLKQLRSSSSTEGGQTKGKTDVLSLSAFKDSLRLRPVDSGATKSSVVIGGSDDALPMSVFGKDMRDRKEAESTTMKTEFLKTYSYEELGKKLRKLRPETGAESCFSLKELNERLMKLREMEEKETESKFGGLSFKDLRESLVCLRISEDEKAKKSSIQRLDILGRLGGTPSFMLAPPKEHLVEQASIVPFSFSFFPASFSLIVYFVYGISMVFCNLISMHIIFLTLILSHDMHLKNTMVWSRWTVNRSFSLSFFFS